MPSPEEIRRRVNEADTARSARRSAAATQIGELAQRRAAVAEELNDLERQLGDVLAASRDVIDIEELTRFTDLAPSDLNRWLAGRKATRTKRKRSAVDAEAKNDKGHGSSAARTPTAAPEPAERRADAADSLARPAGVT